jgi:hypothetical protein
MQLSFKTQINNNPTYFIENIWNGLLKNQISTISEYQNYRFKYNDVYKKDWDEHDDYSLNIPKLHTIREDKKDRWKAGNLIHPVIKPKGRFSAGFQFAPTFPCVSVQHIKIWWQFSNEATIFIRTDNQSDNVPNYKILKSGEIERLAINDGFETVKDFFNYFNKDFTGKIIHFSDLRY